MTSFRNALHSYECGVQAVEKSLNTLRHDFWRLVCFGWGGTSFTASRWRTLFFWPFAELGILVIAAWLALTAPSRSAEEVAEPRGSREDGRSCNMP